jgi:hypothetical protein
MARTRIKGDKISIMVGGTEYNLDATSIVFSQSEADQDVVTFADAGAGGSYNWSCAVTALQSTEATSWHTFLWTNNNTTVAFVFKPWGNTTPSATQPHFTGNLKISGKLPDIGGQADSVWTFSETFDVDGAITRKVA